MLIIFGFEPHPRPLVLNPSSAFGLGPPPRPLVLDPSSAFGLGIGPRPLGDIVARISATVAYHTVLAMLALSSISML